MRLVVAILCFSVLVSVARSETEWESYLGLPSTERAVAVQEIEYTAGTPGHEQGYWAPDLEILANQVLAGDVESLRLALRLTKSTDGGLLGELTSILGKASRIQPALFLREAGEFGLSASVLEAVLRGPGLEYTDRSAAGLYEIAQRRIAIESVSDSSLVRFRERCLAILGSGR